MIELNITSGGSGFTQLIRKLGRKWLIWVKEKAFKERRDGPIFICW